MSDFKSSHALFVRAIFGCGAALVIIGGFAVAQGGGVSNQESDVGSRTVSTLASCQGNLDWPVRGIMPLRVTKVVNEGETVWGQISAQIRADNPDIPDSDLDRRTLQLVKELKIFVNPDEVPAGFRFVMQWKESGFAMTHLVEEVTPDQPLVASYADACRQVN